METALKKLLMNLLVKEYPKIKDIHVSGDEFGYSVGIYMKYNDMSVLDRQDILDLKEKIRSYGKYVLGTENRINSIYFYEPQN
jgi:hypothetical protein